MNISKFTQKSVQAVQDLEKVAYEYGNQEVEQEHLLYALLTQEDSLILKLIEKMDINKEYFINVVKKALDAKVKVSGGDLRFGQYLNKSLVNAENEAKAMGDEYVSVEHLFLSLLTQPSPGMKKIAVIILNWNGADLLRRFLPSVCAHTNANIADVIVVDNGSDDNSVEVLKQEFPQVKTLLFPQNYGFAAGYNKALEMLDYKYAVLLNSDVETTPHWLEPLLEFAEGNLDVAACQPKIKSLRKREEFEYAGAAGGFIDRYGYPFCRGRIFNTLETDRGQYDDICDIFWASGAALFVRSEIYKKVGGLDPSFFAHMEEIDLCWRIHLAGYHIAVVPQSTVYHLGGASLDAANPRKTYLNFRNNLLMLHKNLPCKEGKKTLFVRRLYDTLAFVRFALLGQFSHARAILRAHNDFRQMRKRYTEFPNTDLLKTFPESGRNITIDYFLKGKKRFR